MNDKKEEDKEHSRVQKQPVFNEKEFIDKVLRFLEEKQKNINADNKTIQTKE